MGGIDLNKKLWRIPQQGMLRGVCAGIAQYLDVPVKLVRILVVLSIFFGLAFYHWSSTSFWHLCLIRCRITLPQASSNRPAVSYWISSIKNWRRGETLT